MSVTVTGHSDDLIEIDGDIREEWGVYGDVPSRHMAFSDGTVLRIHYDDDGLWRVTMVVAGAAEFRHDPGDVTADRNDVATLTGVDIRWVLLGAEHKNGAAPLALAKKKPVPS